MSCGMLQNDSKVTQTRSKDCNSFENAEEATPPSCEHFTNSRKPKLTLLSNKTGFIGADDEQQKQNLITNESNTKFPSETSVENTELANALLSLSGKNLVAEKDENFKNIFSKHGLHPYTVTQTSSPSTFNNNTWVGNSSAALIGYPFSYGINQIPPCGCSFTKSYANQDWLSIQQQTNNQEPKQVDTQGIKQNQYFSSAYQQPWFLAPSSIPMNYPSWSSLQNMNPRLPAAKLHQQQQQQSFAHAHVPVGLLQQQQMQLYPQNVVKMSADDPQQHAATVKQELGNPVALVAPMILEFNQSKHVQGIPLIYNVNQWLNMPSAKYAANSPEGQQPVMNYAGNSPCKINDEIQDRKTDPGNINQNTASKFVNKDAITQLGEAANLILFNQNFAAGHCLDLQKQKFNDHCALQTGSQLDSTLTHLEGTYNDQSKQVATKKEELSAKSIKSLKNRTCSYCQRVFARPFTLKSHIRRHTKEKPYTCQVCQRSFSQSATLENHKLTHSGDKPHQCNACFKRFAHQTSLKTHLRIHSGEQPYQCEYCGRRFSDGSTLQKHKRTHSGERPFRCLFCDKCFSQSGNMRRHMASTHKTNLLAKQTSQPATDQFES
eukprot:gene8757-9692_t